MTAEDVYQIVTQGIWAILIAAGPALLVALVVGLGIALFQALTSVQDMTLTFVPKVSAILVTLALSLPFMYVTLTGLSDQVFDMIISDSY